MSFLFASQICFAEEEIMEEDIERIKSVYLLRLTLIFCLLIAALNVLGSLTGTFYYWAYLAGKVTQTNHPEFYEFTQEFAKSPTTFLLLNFYNIVLWNGVIVASIWLFRYFEPARKILKFLLASDMIVTVVHLLWTTATGDAKIDEPYWFIALNTVQVFAIIALSHPRIMQITESLTPKKEPVAPPADSRK
ncbi:MAG: hypothetical protein ACOX5R_11925 [bacterium]